MDPTSIMRGTLEIANQAFAGLAAMAVTLLLIFAAPLRNQWRLLAQGPRWGNPWTDFEAEERVDSLTSERRAA